MEDSRTDTEAAVAISEGVVEAPNVQLEASEPDKGASVEREDSSLSAEDAFEKALRASLREANKEETPQKAEQPKAEPQPQVAKKVETPAQAATTPPPASNEPKAILAPWDMKAEYKEKFKQLPNEFQSYLSERAYEMNRDYQQKTSELARIKNQYARLDQVFDEGTVSHYRKAGVDPATVVQQAIAWDRAMEQDPVNAAREFLSKHGILPEELIAAGNAEPAQRQRPAFDERSIDEIVEKKLLAKTQEYEMMKQYEENERLAQEFVKEKPLFRDPATATQLEAAMRPHVEAIRQNSPELSKRKVLEFAYNAVTHGYPQFAELASSLSARAQAEATKQNAMNAIGTAKTISGAAGSISPKRNLDFEEELAMRLNGSY